MGIAAAVVGGAVISGAVASNNASKAAKAQQRGVDTATGEQQRQFDATSADLKSANKFNRNELMRGGQQAVSSLREGEQTQFDQLSPYAQTGTQALGQQQALLGLGGQQQQQDAFNQFAESPGQKFIRDRAQKSLLRNSAAIGGLGGGNVRSALVERGAGFAAQDYNNQLGQLSALSVNGQNAAANIGQGALTTAGNVASTQFNTAQGVGAGAINTAARQGQFGQNMATNVGNLAIQGGNARATGITNQSNAVQSAIGGIATGIGQSGLLSGASSSGVGGSINDYTGSQFSNWVGNQ